nr:MAG TPA: hypothetical protein [Caudoviricetes sp.]
MCALKTVSTQALGIPHASIRFMFSLIEIAIVSRIIQPLH